MTKKKTLLLVFALLVVGMAVAVPNLLAYGRDKGHMERGIGERPMPLHIPDLTTEQLSKMQKLRLEYQKDILPLRTQLQTKHLELHTLIIEDANSTKINTKIEEIGKIRTDLMKKQVALRVEIRKLLTKEQKTYFDARRFGRGYGCRGRFGIKSRRCHHGSGRW